MDELANLYSRQLQKIDDLNVALVLINQKTNAIDTLLQMKDKTVAQTTLLVECRTAIQQFRGPLMEKFKILIKKSQQIQLDMLHILSELDEKETTYNDRGYETTKGKLSSVKKYMLSSNKENGLITPKYQQGSILVCVKFLSETLVKLEENPFVLLLRLEIYVSHAVE